MMSFGPIAGYPLASIPEGVEKVYDIGTASDSVQEVLVRSQFSDVATASDSLSHTVRESIIDQPSTASDNVVDEGQADVLLDQAAASDSLSDGGTFKDIVEDVAQATDRLEPEISDIVQDQATASDTVQEYMHERVSDEAEAADTLSDSVDQVDKLSDVASATDSVKETIKGVFSDQATASDSLSDSTSYFDSISDQATAADTVAETLAGTADAFTDTAQAGDTHSDTLNAVETVEDVAVASDTAEDLYGLTAWTCHVETFGMSRYLGMPVEEIAVDGTRIIGVGRKGLFAADGTKDNGSPISAYVDIDKTDFGSPALKRARYLYIGYSSPGLMEVVVSQHETGKLKRHRYRIERRKADVAVPGRAKLGRGYKSRYFGVRIANVAGASFQLHDAQLRTDETARNY